MGQIKPKKLLIMAISAAVAFILQLIGIIRYIGRLPDDTVGIVIYIITAALFAIAAFWYYIQWEKSQNKQQA